MNEAPEYPDEARDDIYESRRNTLIDGLARIGWDIEPPAARCSPGRRFPSSTARWEASSSRRCSFARPMSRSRPGVGFGPGGEGHVRFALIENEQRINQATRNLGRALTRLEAP